MLLGEIFYRFCSENWDKKMVFLVLGYFCGRVVRALGYGFVFGFIRRGFVFGRMKCRGRRFGERGKGWFTFVGILDVFYGVRFIGREGWVGS